MIPDYSRKIKIQDLIRDYFKISYYLTESKGARA